MMANNVCLTDCRSNHKKLIHTHTLSLKLRKYSDYLRNTVLTTNEFIPTRNGLKLNWTFLRKEIINSFALFRFLLLDHRSVCPAETKRAILNELKHLLLSIDRLSHLPELIFYELFSSASNRSGSTSQLFHLHLDIWWNTYQIFRQVDPSLTDICLIRDRAFTSGDLLNQFRNLLLTDLITISLIKFNINLLDNNFRHLDAFTCSCVKLVYVLIYLDYESEAQNDAILVASNPFWSDFNKILDAIFGGGDEASQAESVKHFRWMSDNKKLDKNGQFASLWLISSLADLFRQVNIEQLCDDLSGQLKQASAFKFQDNNLYVCRVIKSLIRFEDGQGEVNIGQLLNLLKICFRLSRSWNLSIEIVLIFFDFFMKNLNTPFQLNSNVKNLQMLPRSGHVWYQRLAHLDIVESASLDNEENVNQLFYFLVYNFVRRSADDLSTSNHFQKFKGRLYSKLQAKKIEEFKEIGLFNLLNTFLVISFAAKDNSMDLLNKFLFVVKVVKGKGLHGARMALVLKALFCFNYFLTKSADLVRLNEIIAELFNEICDAMPNWSLSNIQVSTAHNSHFELVNVFCGEVLDYLKNESQPNTAFGNVFKCKFNFLLKKLSEREVLSMLQFIHSLVTEIKFKLENDELNSDLSFYTTTNELINEQFVDFLKVQMQSKSANPQVPTTVYELIYLTILLSANERQFKALVDEFLFAKPSNPLNLCELAVRIVDCDTTFSKILDVYYGCGLDRKLMELWFQITVAVQLPNERFDKLTKQLAVQFPIFKSPNAGLAVVQDVFANLQRKYQQAATNQEKARLCSELNQCLAEMIGQGKVMLKEESASEEIFGQLYTILSYLVLNCCPMIYLQGNSSMALPQILETFFNPNFIQSLPAARAQCINGCIRKTFGKLLIGLTSLYKSNDAYIDRKLKLMFTTYVPLFLAKNSTHPVLLELNQNRAVGGDLFVLLLHYFKDCLFVRPAPNPALTIQLVQFASELYSFRGHHVEQRNQLFQLFPSFLDKLLSSEELTKRKIRDLLTLMVNRSKEQLDEAALAKSLASFYEEFIRKNSDNLIRAIKVLEFTMPFCLLIRENLISTLMYLIKQIEESASGVDDLLRACFQQFVNKLSN